MSKTNSSEEEKTFTCGSLVFEKVEDGGVKTHEGLSRRWRAVPTGNHLQECVDGEWCDDDCPDEYYDGLYKQALLALVGPPPWEATPTKTKEPKTLSDDAPATVGMLRKVIKELKLHVKTLQYPKTAPTVAAYSEEVERERRDRLAKEWLLQFPKNLKEAMRLARSEDAAEVDALEQALETAYQDMDRRMWDCDEWSRYNEELQKSARQAFKEAVRSLLDKLNTIKDINLAQSRDIAHTPEFALATSFVPEPTSPIRHIEWRDDK